MEPGLLLEAEDWSEASSFLHKYPSTHKTTGDLLPEVLVLWAAMGLGKEESSLRGEIESDCLLAPWIFDSLEPITEQEYIKYYHNTQLWTGPEAPGKDNYKTTRALVKEGEWEKKKMIQKSKNPSYSKQFHKLKFQTYKRI